MAGVVSLPTNTPVPHKDLSWHPRDLSFGALALVVILLPHRSTITRDVALILLLRHHLKISRATGSIVRMVPRQQQPIRRQGVCPSTYTLFTTTTYLIIIFGLFGGINER